MFNSKKIKALEEDVSTLYTLLQHQQTKIDGNEAFESFCTNRKTVESSQIVAAMYNYVPTVEPVWESVSVKTLLALILNKMGLKVGYSPGATIVNEIPPEFKLVKKE